MKKIIPLILILAMVLSFVGCAKKQTYIPENAKIYGYNYFPDTDWGMTKDELFNSLDKKETDFTVAEEKFSDATSITHYTTTIKFLDKKCSASFNFQNAHYSDEKSLFSVTVSYPVEKQTEKYIDLKLEALLKEQDIEYNDNLLDKNKDGNWITHDYISKKKMSDLPVDIKKGYIEYYKKVNDKNPVKDPNINKYNENQVPLNEYLSKVTLSYFVTENNSVTCKITFTGYGYALATSFNKANSK